MPPDPLTPDTSNWALFLDVDGTLIEIAETPTAVHVPAALKELLEAVRWRLNGALALVSGRSLASIDQLFTPLRFIASGVHGCERRLADGVVMRPEVDAAKIARVRTQLGEFVLSHEGLLLEDKHYAVAVHFRRAPELQEEVYRVMKDALLEMGPEFALQAGKSVLELRPGTYDKGTAIEAFMQAAPFKGRTPVFIGDDVTDEDAFDKVNELQGISIRVGKPIATVARYRLDNVAAVLRWLSTVPSVTLPDPTH